MRNAKSEIVVRLNSGLGNQLFQFTQGLSLAERMNAHLCYDTTWFSLISGFHPARRHLRLRDLNVPLPEAFSRPRRLVVGILAAFFDRTRRGKFLLSTAGNMVVVQEDATTRRDAHELVHRSAKRIYLNGYWQTSSPFTLVRNQLLPIIQPKNRLSSDTEVFIAKAESTLTGFLHVRRGDYIHFMGDKGALPVTYYARALTKLQEMGKKVTRWMIFSEDTEWARTNLAFVPNADIVNNSSPNRDVEDLMIMKACSAGIIANSSYSWWGAALGDRPDRPIITPDRYWPHAGWIAEGWALPEWTQVRAWD